MTPLQTPFAAKACLVFKTGSTPGSLTFGKVSNALLLRLLQPPLAESRTIFRFSTALDSALVPNHQHPQFVAVDPM
jgi:hypothetical protein